MTTHTQISSAERPLCNDAAAAPYRPLIDLTSDELEMLASLTDQKAPPSPSESTHSPYSVWF
jgi:hypothetical protein